MPTPTLVGWMRYPIKTDRNWTKKAYALIAGGGSSGDYHFRFRKFDLNSPEKIVPVNGVFLTACTLFDSVAIGILREGYGSGVHRFHLDPVY